MFREIFSALDYYKIIVYRSRLEGTRFIHVRYRTIKRVDALFLTERIHALRALHACTVSSRELDSTSWTNSSTRFPLSLFPTEKNEQLSERTMLHYFHESVNPKRYFLKRNVRARIVIFFLKSGRMKKKNVDHPINSRRERNCFSWHGEVSFLQTRGYYKFPLIRTVVNGFMTYKRGDATSCSKKRKIYDIDARLSRPFHVPLSTPRYRSRSLHGGAYGMQLFLLTEVEHVP